MPADEEEGDQKAGQGDHHGGAPVEGRPPAIAPVVELAEAVGDVVVGTLVQLQLLDLIVDVDVLLRTEGGRPAALVVVRGNVPPVGHHRGEAAPDDLGVR